MSLKIELIEMPDFSSTYLILGEGLLDTIGEIISLQDELKSITSKYAELTKERLEAAEAADEYLKSNLHGITPERNRVFIVRGIESEMQVLVDRGLQIKHTLDNILP